jgi:ATP-binding cassette subfamily F protein uup
VDHTFVLEGDGAIKDFPGNYTEYRLWKSNQKTEGSAKDLPVLEEIASQAPTPEKPKTETPVKKLSYKTQRELQDLEVEIPHLELKKKELENRLAEGLSDYNEIQKISEEVSKVTLELDAKSTRWLEIQEEL